MTTSFTSKEFRQFCDQRHIGLVIGLPHHHQGQGLVETRIRSIRRALVAALGERAQQEWAEKKHLGLLERIMNNTVVTSTGMSPFKAMTGHDAHSPPLSSVADMRGVDIHDEDYASHANDLIDDHLHRLAGLQTLLRCGSSLSQAETIRRHEKGRKEPQLEAGDYFLRRVEKENKMSLGFMGPYKATEVTNTTIKGVHYLTPEAEPYTFRIEEVRAFNAQRLDAQDLSFFQSQSGYGIVAEVLGHKVENGVDLFHVSWYGGGHPSGWLPYDDLRHNSVVTQYISSNGISLVKGPGGPRSKAAQGRK